MDAIDYLQNEHVEHKKLLERIVSGKMEDFAQSRAAIIRHIHLEETVIFQEYRHVTEIKQAWFEHNELMQLLKSIDEEFSLEKVKQLLKLHEDHTRDEESFVFPFVRKHIPADVLTQMRFTMINYRDEVVPDAIIYPDHPGEHQIGPEA